MRPPARKAPNKTFARTFDARSAMASRVYGLTDRPARDAAFSSVLGGTTLESPRPACPQRGVGHAELFLVSVSARVRVRGPRALPGGLLVVPLFADRAVYSYGRSPGNGAPAEANDPDEHHRRDRQLHADARRAG